MRKAIINSVLIILLLTAALRADKTSEPQSTVTLPNGVAYKVEIAATDADRIKGLMFRENLPDDRGMLFIFDGVEFHAFHMKNTLIPLDIIWLNREFEIIYFVENVPPCRREPCESYMPFAKASYVLELNANTITRQKLQIGDKLRVKIVR